MASICQGLKPLAESFNPFGIKTTYLPTRTAQIRRGIDLTHGLIFGRAEIFALPNRHPTYALLGIIPVFRA